MSTVPTDAHSVPLGEISLRLERLFETHSEEHSQVLDRSVTENTVIYHSVGSERGVSEASVQSALELVSRVRAGRIFVVRHADPRTSELEPSALSASVSARCQGGRPGEELCAEVVQLDVGDQMLDRVPSIVQAHALPGFPIDLVFVGNRLPAEAVELFVPLSDQVIFHGSQLAGRSELAHRLLDHEGPLVDLMWIELAAWRGEVKQAFSAVPVQEQLDELVGVELHFHVGDGKSGLRGLLMAGWILDRLKMSVTAIGVHGFECRLPSGSGVDLLYTECAAEEAESICFSFGPSGERRVKISCDIVFETNVELCDGTRTTHNELPSQSLTSCLERYFLIGESVQNYRSALRRGLELLSLRKGFAGL